MPETSAPPERKSSLRHAGLAAVVGAAAWLTKFVVIWAGAENENLHGTLHVLGTVALLTALAIAAWTTTSSRGAGVRVLAVVGSWLLLFLVVGAVEESINAVVDAGDGSVLEELVLLVIGLPALAVGARAALRPSA